MNIILYNPLLRSNALLMRIVILLLKCKFHDALFIPNMQRVRLHFKGNELSYMEYRDLIGYTYEDTYITMNDYTKMIHQLKLECNLNILIMQPQSGSFKLTFNNINYFIRVSLHPADYGIEALSLRLIRPEVITNIDIQLMNGLVLIGGRTCSGKTSMMYRILANLAKSGKTIVTLEDPVEYTIDGIIQSDVRHIGYEEGIRSVLRQNPDWICIGEIRDTQSAMAAVRAAMTGHNVIATIHISDGGINNILARFEEMNCKYLQQVLSQFIYCYRNTNDFAYISHDNLQYNLLCV